MVNEKKKQVSTDLVKIQEMNALTLFSPGGLDDLLDAIEEEVINEKHDARTEKGRKAIKALCSKVTASKTCLEGIGKKETDRLRALLSPIDGERRSMKDRLDGLKAKVREPLTEWEDEEAKRIKDLDDGIQAILNLSQANEMRSNIPFTSEQLKENLDKLEAMDMTKDFWGEKFPEAGQAMLESLPRLKKALSRRITWEEQQVELEELRAKQEIADKAEEERRIADAARAESEGLLRIAEEKAVQAEKAKVLAEMESEKLAQEAKERAESEKQASIQAAVEAEQERIAEDLRQKEESDKIRLNDLDHRKTINRKILGYLVNELDYPEKEAKDLITVIARGDMPHVSIEY